MEDSSSRILFVEDVRSSRSSRTDHRQLTMSPICSRNSIIKFHSMQQKCHRAFNITLPSINKTTNSTVIKACMLCTNKKSIFFAYCQLSLYKHKIMHTRNINSRFCAKLSNWFYQCILAKFLRIDKHVSYSTKIE